VDDTDYYADDLTNPEEVLYTLFGPSGDQDESEKKFNEPLLNPEKTKHIYLYRVTKDTDKYRWYGKYAIINKASHVHVGKDGCLRKIILLTMKKID